MAAKIKQIQVGEIMISIASLNREDYICLTDMAKEKEGNNRAADIIKNWMRNPGIFRNMGTIIQPEF